MLNKQDVARLVIAAAIFSAGCDKDKSGSSSTAGSGSAQTSAQSTAAGTTAGPTVSELVATYNAVSAVEGSDNKKHQALTLNADNTAALDTEIMVNGNPQKTIGSQHATGTYAVKRHGNCRRFHPERWQGNPGIRQDAHDAVDL